MSHYLSDCLERLLGSDCFGKKKQVKRDPGRARPGHILSGLCFVPIDQCVVGKKKVGYVRIFRSGVLGYFDHLHESFIGFLLCYSRVCLGNAKNFYDFLCFYVEGSPSTLFIVLMVQSVDHGVFGMLVHL